MREEWKIIPEAVRTIPGAREFILESCYRNTSRKERKVYLKLLVIEKLGWII